MGRKKAKKKTKNLERRTKGRQKHYSRLCGMDGVWRGKPHIDLKTCNKKHDILSHVFLQNMGLISFRHSNMAPLCSAKHSKFCGGWIRSTPEIKNASSSFTCPRYHCTKNVGVFQTVSHSQCMPSRRHLFRWTTWPKVLWWSKRIWRRWSSMDAWRPSGMWEPSVWRWTIASSRQWR